MDGWVRFPDVPAKPMNTEIAFKRMTALITALYAVLNLLVTFPIAHEHHHAHHCDCPHSIGHWHSGDTDCNDDACAACQILAHSALPVSEFVPASYEVSFLVRVKEQNAASVYLLSADARAPPVS